MAAEEHHDLTRAPYSHYLAHRRPGAGYPGKQEEADQSPLLVEVALNWSSCLDWGQPGYDKV